MKDIFIFEILVIDKNGQSHITKDDSLINGLIFSESLWKKGEVVEKSGRKKIVDNEQKLEAKIQPVDTSSTLNDLIEAAFIIQVKGEDFREMERFRLRFLFHLKNILKFTNIRILHDDISTRISNDIYPLVNNIENLLRRYLVKFFTQKIGVDWWEITAPRSIADKVNMRKNKERIFSELVDMDVTLIDFDDLGEIIYKQTTGFNSQENIITRVMNSQTLDDLNTLKIELQGNYTKYFKEAFQDNNFERKWKTLFEIRNKVAHNNLFVLKDFEDAARLVEDLTRIVNSAEAKIDEFRFTIEEQEALRQATIEAVKTAEYQNEGKERSLADFGIKVVGKIDLPDFEEPDEKENSFKIITQEDLMRELEYAERTLARNNLTYVGLKSFVTKILGNKGYSYKPTYSLINILKDKGIVEIYDAEDEFNFFPTKGIRIKR